MKKLLFIFTLLIASCQPSQQSIQTPIALTQASIPTATSTITPVPTNTPLPTITLTSTPLPTDTPYPTIPPTISAAQIEKTIDALLISIADLLKNHISDIDSVTTIRPGNDSLEIELRTIWASQDNQPNVSFEVIQVLAEIFSQTTEGKAFNLVKGNPTHFSVLLTTYLVDGNGFGA